MDQDAGQAIPIIRIPSMHQTCLITTEVPTDSIIALPHVQHESGCCIGELGKDTGLYAVTQRRRAVFF